MGAGGGGGGGGGGRLFAWLYLHVAVNLLPSFISLRFEHAYSVDFTETVFCKYDTHAVPTASGLQRIAGRAISVKLHPQEVLAAKLGTQYVCSK